MRSEAPVWEALKAGVQVFPRELRALQDEGTALLSKLRLPDIPMLYMYGELTSAPVYASVSEVAARYPQAEILGLAGQRHLAPMFAPATFAAAITAFTARVDG